MFIFRVPSQPIMQIKVLQVVISFQHPETIMFGQDTQEMVLVTDKPLLGQTP